MPWGDNQHLNMRGNLINSVLDEIALEGLDGITLEGLWHRLSERLQIDLPFTSQIKSRIWEIVRCSSCVDIYELPEPRDFLIFDRYKHVDPELGIVFDPDVTPPNIYPFCPIDKNGIRGSCQHFDTRVNITNDAKLLVLDHLEARWGDKIVMVSNQTTRYSALIENNVSINLSAVQYCILERIGRSRYHGEVTLGKISLLDIGETPKSLFYHRKTLLQYKLITKQTHQHKIGQSNNCGGLLHLPRFYVERKPKTLITAEKIFELLKGKPKFIALYEEIKRQFSENLGFKKICKTIEFQRIIRSDIRIKYREWYPDSDESKWFTKNGEERTLRCLQLVDPNIDLTEMWSKEDVEDEEDFGFINNDEELSDMPLMKHAFKVISDGGSDGMTQNQVAAKLGQHRLSARTICRHLVRRNSVVYFMDNVGRQRITRFVSKHYVKDSQIENLYSERNQILQSAYQIKPESDTFASASPEESVQLKRNRCEEKISEAVSAKKKVKRDCEFPEGDIQLKRKESDEEISEEESATKRMKYDKTIMTCETLTTSTSPTITSTSGYIYQNVDKHGIETKIQITKEMPGLKIGTSSLTKYPSCWGHRNDYGLALSYRFIKRANMLIRFIQEEKVINDLSKLMRMINCEEKKGGYHTSIDKRSLFRVMLKVSAEEHIKIFRCTLSTSVRTRVITFLCEPSITPDHTLITSEIERTKMKYFISTIPIPSNPEQPVEIPKAQIAYIKSLYRKSEGKRMGYSPKFVRMRILHEFLFYCIYSHETVTSNLLMGKEEAVAQWKGQGIVIEDSFIEEVPAHVYGNEISWRMFIPALPENNEWPNGWAIMCDILFRLPLSLFVKIVNVTYHLPEVQKYLQHPIKRHLLVKSLPARLRDVLLFSRRYIYSVHQIIIKLCYTGIIQLGPQRYKDKDQLFIYLNRNASVWDTRTSEKSYFQTTEQEYEIKTFKFLSLCDVESYWEELWNVCVHTQLGMRNAIPAGQEIVLETLQLKPAMIEATKARKSLEAIERDDGSIPGDRRGAGGLDSALFAHFKRSWSWLHTNLSSKTGDNHTNRAKTQAKMRLVKIRKKKSLPTLHPTRVGERTLLPGGARKITAIRRIHTHAPKIRKQVYDDVDKEALKLMNKLRVDWSVEEDRLLLLSKVAYLFLSTNTTLTNFICFQNVRDCLQRLHGSRNKTSHACQRRINYMMKNPVTQKSVELCLEETRQCPDIRAIFKNVSTNKADIVFVILVKILNKKFSSINNNNQKVRTILPDTISECLDKFEVYVPRTIREELSYCSPATIGDIQTNILQTIIHSSMCCPADKTSWNFQVFKVYQQYPESLLRSVLAKIRKHQFISMKKSFVRRKLSLNSLTPINSPYQLSITYRNKLMTKHPFEIFHDSYLKLKELEQRIPDPEYEYVSQNGGAAAAIFEMFIKYNLTFTIQIPEQMIILDPAIGNNSDSTYSRVCKRYEEILKSVPITSPAIEPFDDDKEEDANVPIKAIVEGPLDVEQSNTMIKNSSRIALYMMRGELTDSLDEKSSSTQQHMHDFFVVNSSRIYVKTAEKISFPISTTKCKTVLDEVQQRATIPIEKPTLDKLPDLLASVSANKSDVIFCNKILTFIKAGEHLGVAANILQDNFPNSGICSISLQQMLEYLCKWHYVLKCGVSNTQFVHCHHQEHWVINSVRLKRLEREQLRTTMTKECELEKISTSTDYVSEENSMLTSNSSTTRPTDCSSLTRVCVNMAPWIRVDGSINRRVLDRWLGAILSFCIDQPGVSVQKLAMRFKFLKPFDVKSLLEYLEILECVNFFKLEKSKLSLFRKSLPAQLVPATGLEDFKDIIVETNPICITKLGAFIGDKQYKIDFFATDD